MYFYFSNIFHQLTPLTQKQFHTRSEYGLPIHTVWQGQLKLFSRYFPDNEFQFLFILFTLTLTLVIPNTIPSKVSTQTTPTFMSSLVRIAQTNLFSSYCPDKVSTRQMYIKTRAVSMTPPQGADPSVDLLAPPFWAAIFTFHGDLSQNVGNDHHDGSTLRKTNPFYAPPHLIKEKEIQNKTA